MYKTYNLDDDVVEYNLYTSSDLKNINQDGDIVRVNNTLVFNPFNVYNKEITLNDVQSILKDYGIRYNINNIELYKRAFVHSSYVKRTFDPNVAKKITSTKCPPGCVDLKTKSNERLEFIGDGVLELITKYYLYRRFPKSGEGFMTEKKIAVVKNEHIGKLAYELKLGNWLIVSNYSREKKIHTNLKKLGCVFEAFIGAIFLDFNNVRIVDEDNWFQDIFTTGPGFQMAQIFVENVFEKHIDWTNLIATDDNYKNILQVKVQKEFKVTPHYLEIEHDVELGYKMGVYLCLGQQIYNLSHSEAVDISFFKNFKAIQDFVAENGKAFIFMGEGQHKIKRKAEQIACNEAIKFLDIDEK